jgi:adenine deaminase
MQARWSDTTHAQIQNQKSMEGHEKQQKNKKILFYLLIGIDHPHEHMNKINHINMHFIGMDVHRRQKSTNRLIISMLKHKHINKFYA